MEGKTNSAHNSSAAGGVTLTQIYTGTGNGLAGVRYITVNCPSTITPVAYILECTGAFSSPRASTDVIRNFVAVGTSQLVYGGQRMSSAGGSGNYANCCNAVATSTYIQLDRSNCPDLNSCMYVSRVFAVH